VIWKYLDKFTDGMVEGAGIFVGVAFMVFLIKLVGG